MSDYPSAKRDESAQKASLQWLEYCKTKIAIEAEKKLQARRAARPKVMTFDEQLALLKKINPALGV